MSYLNDSFLSDGDAGTATVPAAPAAGEQLPAPAPAQNLVRLPGGIVMPTQTLYLLVIALAIAFYLYHKSKKKTAP